MSNQSKAELLKKQAKKAAKIRNHTETKTGGGGKFEPPPEGWTVARLLEYVELGVQPQRPFKGEKKQPAEQVRVTFELLGKAHITEKDGKKRANRWSDTLVLSLHEKAMFKKLFDKMRDTYTNPKDITYMGQMIGDAFRVYIRHNVKESGGNKSVYIKIQDKQGAIMLTAPRIEVVDEETEEVTFKNLKVPDLIGEPRLFSFDEPTISDWDSLKIEGTRKKKGEDGEEIEESKNYLQEMILAAKNFKGSAVEQMLVEEGRLDGHDEGDDEDEDDADDEAVDDLDEDEEEAPKSKAKAKAPAKKSKPPVDEDEDDEDDEDAEDADEEELDEDSEDAEDEEESDEADEVEDDEEDEDEEEEAPKSKAKSKPKAATGKKPAKVTKPVTKKAPASPAKSKTKSPSKDKAAAKPKKAKEMFDELFEDDED